jgi:hypothetical protein
MMIIIAEELIDAARGATIEISWSMEEVQVDRYQKMISTALGCLEAAMQSQKLPPREEALVRLRYAGILQEETEDIMEAETTLTKGITLCEKVCFIAARGTQITNMRSIVCRTSSTPCSIC